METKLCLVIVISLAVGHARLITVSPNCPTSSSCVTLPNLVLPSSGNVSIVLLSGVHSFESSLTIQNRASVSITGTPGETIVNCATQRSENLRLSRISNILIRGITFEGCNFDVVRCNNTNIRRSSFVNGTNGALEFSNCFNISIDRSSFTSNRDSSFGGVIEISSSKKFAITRSNFTNNYVSSFSAVIDVTSASSGFISCCNFHNNSAGAFGGVVKTESDSVIFVTNSSFTENQVDAFGGVVIGDSGAESVTVISCVFAFNRADSFGGALKMEDGIANVLASDFSSNRAGGFGGAIVVDRSGQVDVDCTHFFNNSRTHFYTGRNSILSVQNTSTCVARYALGAAGICQDHIDCEVCQPPEVNVAMEFTAYSAKENIQFYNFALQVCAVATDVPFTVVVVMQVTNGTAEEGTDFISMGSECSILTFTSSGGTQRHCLYIEILDDDVIEAEEHFTVRLSSTNPRVTLTGGEATVSIVDDDRSGIPDTTQRLTEAITTAMYTTTTATTVADSTATRATGTMTALVECGIFSRPVIFVDSGDDLSSLKDAIVRTFSFSGLESTDIAFLQIKLSEESFQGHFVDIIDTNTRIEHNSVIRVVPYSRNVGICRV